MSTLNGTETHNNLKAAFAGESQANRRDLWMAKVADVLFVFVGGWNLKLLKKETDWIDFNNAKGLC